MAAQIEPGFLVAWVRAELAATGEEPLMDALAARALQDGLDEEEAQLDVAGQLAERRGLLNALETAVGDLWLAEVREARGASERLEKAGPSCIAFLRATPGAAARLASLAQALLLEPGKTFAELNVLGGTPGCSTR